MKDITKICLAVFFGNVVGIFIATIAKASFGESNMEQVIFFSGIIFGQTIGILFGPKIYQMVKSKIESYRNRKTTQQMQIIVDPFYVEIATGKYFFRSDLIKKYGRKGLFHLIAKGIFEHELVYEKRNLS